MPIRMPLERKLPLLMAGVLALVLTAALLVTYQTLTASAESTARDRMQRASQAVAGTVQSAIRDRSTRLQLLARDTSFIRALRQRDTVTLAAGVAGYRIASDSLLTTEVLDAARRTVISAGPALEPAHREAAFSRWLPAAARNTRRLDSVTISPLYGWQDRVLFWLLAPVRSGGQTIGYVVHQRRTTGPQEATNALRAMIGDDVTLQIRNRDGTFWTAAPGSPATSPLRRDSAGTRAFDILPTGERMIVTEAGVEGAPWMVVLHAPESQVLARPRATLLQLILISAAIAAVGAVVAFGIGRRITRPLSSLTKAAEAIALGDYDRRVTVEGDDEVGRLGRSFNTMTLEIERSRRALESRTADAESAREEAQRANRAKADFLAVMSHELRTPLNAISGYAELLNLGIYGNLSDAQREPLTRIIKSQEHLLALINDVLNFAKIDAAQIQYDVRALPAADAVNAIEPLVAPQLRTKGLEYRCSPCDPRVLVHADADKLQQVLLNLVTNAMKFTQPGGTISIKCRALDEKVAISVSDTGAGIAPEKLAVIFEPFVQGYRALNRPNEGVGLGLTISRDLVEGMGGRISVESVVGKGSTFTVTLERAGAHSRSREMQESASE